MHTKCMNQKLFDSRMNKPRQNSDTNIEIKANHAN